MYYFHSLISLIITFAKAIDIKINNISFIEFEIKFLLFPVISLKTLSQFLSSEKAKNFSILFKYFFLIEQLFSIS